MLSEAKAHAGGEELQKVAVLEKCREIGIIPRSTEEIERSEQLNSSRITANEDSAPRLNLNLMISGMWCPACAWMIEEAVRKQRGIENASCRFATDRFSCRYDPVKTSPRAVIRFIESIGYRAVPEQDGNSQKEEQWEWIRLAICAFLTMNIMMFSFSLYSGFFKTFSEETIYRLSFPIAVLSSIVMIYGGKEIFRKTILGLSTGAFGVETLTSIGSLAAYGFSSYQFVSGSIHLYYDASAMLITLLLLGKRLESKGRRRISRDLNLISSLVPKKVRICTDRFPHGRYVPIDRLKTGDRFMVSKEELVAADGMIMEGNGFVDESSLTGEARPVHKHQKDILTAGSRIISGDFQVRADAIGDQSFLGRMIGIMEETLKKKSRFEQKSEYLLRWFVPGIVWIAVITGVAWVLVGLSIEEALIRSISVVVISCPCALGIAVPLAHVAGVSLGLKHGILIRDFSGAENSERIAVFVFDKTGTVTEGKWHLVNIRTLHGFTEETILGLAAGLERDSDHYIALEIKRTAEFRKIAPLPITGLKLDENGISGRHMNVEVKIGSREFLKKEILDSANRDMLQEEGLKGESRRSRYSDVYMSCNGSICAELRFEDALKEEAADAVMELKNAGYDTVLVSGDSSETTGRIAHEIGIRKAHGGKLPLEKAALIDGLKKDVGPVAMVGDGINDAPAMLRADLAIAMNSGNHLGKEASHIILMRNDLLQISEFLKIARQVRKKIHQNLGWAFGYNAAGIPLAAFGFLIPILAAGAMLLSSLSIIGNTLLLIRNR
jgi:heavy metal translocating P-type ATPase